MSELTTDTSTAPILSVRDLQTYFFPDEGIVVQVGIGGADAVDLFELPR